MRTIIHLTCTEEFMDDDVHVTVNLPATPMKDDIIYLSEEEENVMINQLVELALQHPSRFILKYSHCIYGHLYQWRNKHISFNPTDLKKFTKEVTEHIDCIGISDYIRVDERLFKTQDNSFHISLK